MTVLAVASRKGRNQRMGDAGKETPALTTIICCVLAKNLRHSVTCRRGHNLDAEVACYPRPETIPSTAPLRRGFSCFLISTNHSGGRKRIRAKRIECK